jgi:hypothetical protein
VEGHSDRQRQVRKVDVVSAIAMNTAAPVAAIPAADPTLDLPEGLL